MAKILLNVENTDFRAASGQVKLSAGHSGSVPPSRSFPEALHEASSSVSQGDSSHGLTKTSLSKKDGLAAGASTGTKGVFSSSTGIKAGQSESGNTAADGNSAGLQTASQAGPKAENSKKSNNPLSDITGIIAGLAGSGILKNQLIDTNSGKVPVEKLDLLQSGEDKTIQGILVADNSSVKGTTVSGSDKNGQQKGKNEGKSVSPAKDQSVGQSGNLSIQPGFDLSGMDNNTAGIAVSAAAAAQLNNGSAASGKGPLEAETATVKKGPSATEAGPAAVKTKEIEDLKAKGSDDVKTKDLKDPIENSKAGLDDKTGNNGQKENNGFGQSGYSVSSKRDTGGKSMQTKDPQPGQNGLLKTDSQAGGADSQGAAAKDKFVMAAQGAGIKNIQSAPKEDGTAKAGPPQAGQAGMQAADKGLATVSGSTASSGSFTDHVQTETVKGEHLQDEPFVITKQTDNSIEVKIEPEGLGKMDIKLFMDKGHLNAHIHASESIGKEVIERSLGSITSKLAEEGINVGSFSVSLRDRRNGGQQTSEDGNKSTGKTRAAAQIEQTGPKPVSSAGGGLLSLFA